MLILIRGIPGAGKSILAAKLGRPHVIHFETDAYFVDIETGEYKFDPSKLAEYHLRCFTEAHDALKNHKDCTIIVSNTFTTKREMEPYINAARSLGHDIQVISCVSTFKNIHNVPEHTIQRMSNRWEEFRPSDL